MQKNSDFNLLQGSLEYLLKGKHGNSMGQDKKVPGAINGAFPSSYKAGRCLNFYQPKSKELTKQLLNSVETPKGHA